MSDLKQRSSKSFNNTSPSPSSLRSIDIPKNIPMKQDIESPKAVATTVTATRMGVKPPPINTSQLKSSPSTSSIKQTKDLMDGFSGTANWGQYILSRFNIVAILLVAFGYMLSAFYYYEVDNELFRLKLGEFFWGGLTLTLSLILLRFMDDAKDWTTEDIIANPNRPLPQCIVNPREMKKVILGLTGLLIVNAICIGVFVDWSAGVFAFVILVFQSLMWKEFGIGKKLEKRPLIYALVRQPVTILHIIFALCMFHDSDALRAIESWFLAIYFFGVAFTYEISRKLDPNAHPALGYYHQFYGRGVTMIMLLTTIGICAVGAFLLGLNLLTWIADFIVLIATGIYLYVLSKDAVLDKNEIEFSSKLPPADPKAKIIEIVVTVSTIWHILIIPIVGWSDMYSPI